MHPDDVAQEKALADVELAWQRLRTTSTWYPDARKNYQLADELEDQLRSACHAAIDTGTPETEKAGIKGLEYLAQYGEHANTPSSEGNPDGRFLARFAHG